MAVQFDNDTIVALATPEGRGSIAGIRISGGEAFKIFSNLLPLAKRDKVFVVRQVNLSWLVSKEGERIDQVTFVKYLAPNSFTGEEVVEIFCHGGRLVATKLIERLCEEGCRIAEPGEFTRRAVLNHKLDLIQAEAILDVVEAESPAGLASALAHLEGSFSRKIKDLRAQLLHTCGLLELGLDFSEEDVEFADREQMQTELDQLDHLLQEFLDGFRRRQALKDGWRVAIIGKPNVGKSSLMNSLLREDRVIVSAEPGTTRDTVEDRLLLGEHLFRLIDTAGIRSEGNEIEMIGIQRSRRMVESADLILFVTDASTDGDRHDREIAAECLKRSNGKLSSAIIQVLNKIDLTQAQHPFVYGDGAMAVKTSAITGEGIEDLEREMVRAVAGDGKDAERATHYINLRQKKCLEQAREALACAKRSLDDGLSAEFIALDLRQVVHHLGALIGEVTSEEVLGEIFANFCIGK